MDTSYNQENINAAAGKSILEIFARSFLNDIVENLSEIHPMMRLFFDSELGSDIEKQTLISLTDNILRTTGFFADTNDKLKNVHEKSVIVLEFASEFMCLAKLLYHANTGRITSDELYERVAEYITIKYVALIIQVGNSLGERLPDFLSKNLKDILIYLNTNEKKAEKISSQIQILSNMAFSWVKENITEAKIQEIITFTLKNTVESLRKVLEVTNSTVETGIDIYKVIISDLKTSAREVFDFFGWEFPEMLKKETKVSVEKTSANNELSAEEKWNNEGTWVIDEDNNIGKRNNRDIIIDT